MKFTRIFILRAINMRDDGRNPQNPLVVLKEIIISHPSIDLTITLILSLLLMITKLNDDVNYIHTYSLNIYFISTINLVALLYYFTLEFFDQITMLNLNNGSQSNSRSNVEPLVENNNNNQNN